ncbi:MAG: formylglycine-generating enzyme family protein [Polyangiaceae bacterium]
MNTQADANNCGGCGSKCPTTTPYCTQGSCNANPASCQAEGPGRTNCGAAAESCCTSLEVTAGTYFRTYDVTDGGAATNLADPASVSGFRLDKYLVTVGRFRQFVEAWNNGSGWKPQAGSGKHTHLNGGRGLANVGSGGGYEPGWMASNDSEIAPTTGNLSGARGGCDAGCVDAGPWGPSNATWTAAAGSNENLPINYVSWYEAYAFCIWDGAFLPSEAEWEYAAAGGSQQRAYPWGATAPGTASQYAIYGCYYPGGGVSDGGCGLTSIAPVGTATSGAGAWDQLDLAGELSEMNLAFYAAYVNPCVDCANLTDNGEGQGVYGDFFGGAFGDSFSSWLLPSRRFRFVQRDSATGFRCARTP